MGTGIPDSQSEIFQAFRSLSLAGQSGQECSEAVCVQRKGRKEGEGGERERKREREMSESEGERCIVCMYVYAQE